MSSNIDWSRQAYASRHGCVRQRQHGQYLFVGKQEGLLGNLEPIGSFEIEPRVGWHLSGEILLGGAVEEHVGGEGLSVQGSQGEPPRLDHRRPLEPPALGFVVARDHHRKLVREGHLEQGRRKTGAEFVGHFTRGGQGHSLQLLDPWNEKVVGQDQIRGESVGMPFWIQRIVCEIIDGVVAYDTCYDFGEVAGRVISAARNPEGLKLTGVSWAYFNARWTMGTKDIDDTLKACAAYTLAPVADRIRQDVLMLAGTDDHFIPFHQSADFEKALVNARSVTTRVFDGPSGGAGHCQPGALSLYHAAVFDWLLDKFPATPK